MKALDEHNDFYSVEFGIESVFDRKTPPKLSSASKGAKNI